jgi:hypothetical protein
MRAIITTFDAQAVTLAQALLEGSNHRQPSENCWDAPPGR